MLKKLEENFSIQSIVEQVEKMPVFDKFVQLNEAEPGRLLNGPYTVKSEFIDTPLGNVLTQLGNIGEARLLKLRPEESYMAHCDPDDRLQISIITNEYCRIIDLEQNQMFYLPVDGSVWLMDTGNIHVASNFGAHDRIHLNIRVLLPDVTDGWVRYIVEGGDYDWKHLIQISITRWINRAIKQGNLTGLRKVTDREILINPRNQECLDELIRIGQQAGFTIKTSTT